jgi:hypothetical protein
MKNLGWFLFPCLVLILFQGCLPGSNQFKGKKASTPTQNSQPTGSDTSLVSKDLSGCLGVGGWHYRISENESIRKYFQEEAAENSCEKDSLILTRKCIGDGNWSSWSQTDNSNKGRYATCAESRIRFREDIASGDCKEISQSQKRLCLFNGCPEHWDGSDGSPIEEFPFEICKENQIIPPAYFAKKDRCGSDPAGNVQNIIRYLSTISFLDGGCKSLERVVTRECIKKGRYFYTLSGKPITSTESCREYLVRARLLNNRCEIAFFSRVCNKGSCSPLYSVNQNLNINDYPMTYTQCQSVKKKKID